MNRIATQWLDKLIAYEDAGGWIPEDIKANLRWCLNAEDYNITIYTVRYNILWDDFASVIEWIEENGPDEPEPWTPKPNFGLFVTGMDPGNDAREALLLEAHNHFSRKQPGLVTGEITTPWLVPQVCLDTLAPIEPTMEKQDLPLIEGLVFGL